MTGGKSPLPGWDPYLLRYWRDVHQSLVVYTRDYLRAQLPSDLRVRVEERVFLEAEDDGIPRSGSYVPDVSVVEWPRGSAGTAAVTVEEAVAEPVKFRYLFEPLTEGYIEIFDTSSRGRLVTSIEFTSPTNKAPGKGSDSFRKKQHDCQEASVSVVEIDLIGMNIRQRLPAIRIPLRPSDKQARLDIQAVFDQAYLNGGYEADIDYSKDPEVPLTAEEKQWLDTYLREQNLRK